MQSVRGRDRRVLGEETGVARRIGDRTALFFDGRLVEEGPTAQLFLSPKHAETVRYISGFTATQPRGGADGGRER